MRSRRLVLLLWLIGTLGCRDLVEPSETGKSDSRYYARLAVIDENHPNEIILVEEADFIIYDDEMPLESGGYGKARLTKFEHKVIEIPRPGIYDVAVLNYAGSFVRYPNMFFEDVELPATVEFRPNNPIVTGTVQYPEGLDGDLRDGAHLAISTYFSFEDETYDGWHGWYVPVDSVGEFSSRLNPSRHRVRLSIQNDTLGLDYSWDEEFELQPGETIDRVVDLERFDVDLQVLHPDIDPDTEFRVTCVPGLLGQDAISERLLPASEFPASCWSVPGTTTLILRSSDVSMFIQRQFLELPTVGPVTIEFAPSRLSVVLTNEDASPVISTPVQIRGPNGSLSGITVDGEASFYIPDGRYLVSLDESDVGVAQVEGDVVWTYTLPSDGDSK